MTMSPHTYLLCFSNELAEFRLPELRAVLSLLGVEALWTPPPADQPFLLIQLADEATARAVAERTVAVKSCLELWAGAESEDELHVALRCRLRERPDTMLPHFGADTSFRIVVDAFNKRLSHADKMARVAALAYLPLRGPVRLHGARLRLHLVEDYGPDSNLAPPWPLRLYFGRWVCDGARAAITRHSLKRRAYIGNTSMDPELALVMANMARVRPGDVVLDPFVGTGSLLVAAAHFGGHVLGTDIDYSTVHACTRQSRVQERGQPRGRHESIAANLAQYGLHSRLLDVLVADAGLPALWRRGVTVDAIVTDPPYGIREVTRRLAGAGVDAAPAGRPATVVCDAGEQFSDLLTLAAERLTVGGRLVFWLPVTLAEYTADRLPGHPCLRLEDNSEQRLTRHSSRRLLTMHKWRELADHERHAAVVHESTARFKERYFSPTGGGTVRTVPVDGGRTVQTVRTVPVAGGGTVRTVPVAGGGMVRTVPVAGGGMVRTVPVDGGGTVRTVPVAGGGTVRTVPVAGGGMIRTVPVDGDRMAVDRPTTMLAAVGRPVEVASGQRLQAAGGGTNRPTDLASGQSGEISHSTDDRLVHDTSLWEASVSLSPCPAAGSV